MMQKLFNESADRNKEPICNVLSEVIQDDWKVLEIAAGSGQHASWICQQFPKITWQATDIATDRLMSINTWKNEDDIHGMLESKYLNCLEPNSWPQTNFDLIVNINMIHISPWEATLGLFACVSSCLKPGGKLFLYGPYFWKEQETAPSNLKFNQWLQSENSLWGLRHLEEIIDLAVSKGLFLESITKMPANNLAVIFGFKNSHE